MDRQQVVRRDFPPATPLRLYRVQRGVRLQDVSSHTGISLFRCSIIERDPSKARPGEIDLMKAAVDACASEVG